MSEWFGDISRLESPEALLLLVVLVPAAIFAGARRRPALRFSSMMVFEATSPTLRVRLAWIPTALRVLGLVCLAVALARPQHGRGETRVKAEGVAIMAVVDRSWSMTERMAYDGQQMSRIDVVKRVFREFVEGNGEDLEGRAQDLIGLVAFARYADTVCPLVRSHDVLSDLVDTVELVNPTQNNYEAGTAIGEGLALAAARLEKAEQELARAQEEEGVDPDFTIKSKIIILLTDGDENMDEIPARAAAQFCKELGIKVYAIGIAGGGEGGRGFFGRPRYPFDGRTIREVAQITDGLYRVVESGDALRDVYEEIDRQEKTEIESIEYTSYDERFVAWAALGAGLIVLEILLGSTLLRRSP